MFVMLWVERVMCEFWNRCVIRYGYKDLHRDDHDFENELIINLGEFIQSEGDVPWIPSSDEVSADGQVGVMSSPNSARIMTTLTSDSDPEESYISMPSHNDLSQSSTSIQVCECFCVDYQIL